MVHWVQRYSAVSSPVDSASNDDGDDDPSQVDGGDGGDNRDLER
jgi:hypothetical protein